MELHANLIDGDWVEGEAVPNVNPANTAEVVGHYARATAADAERAIAAAKAAFPAWSRSGPLERHAVLRKAADEITARKEEIGTPALARGGQDAGRGHRRDGAGGADLRLLRRRVPAALRRDPAVGAARRRRRDHPRGGRAGRAHHPLELPDRDPGLEDRPGAGLGQHRRHQAGRPGAGLHLGDRRHPAPRRAAEGRAEPRHGQGLGGRPGDPRQHATSGRSASPARSAPGGGSPRPRSR